MKKLVLLSIACLCMTSTSYAFEKDRGGDETVRQKKGVVDVMVMRSGAIATLTGEAAELLFDALQVDAQIPPYSTSQIKTLDHVQCTKNSSETFCMIGIETSK